MDVQNDISIDCKPHVVIVGAGIAGLSSAKKILEEAKDRFEVTILEARSRIGGRVHTQIDPDGYPLEMGANWIHEYMKQNPLYHYTESKPDDYSLSGVTGDRFSLTVWKGDERFIFEPDNDLGRKLRIFENNIDNQEVTIRTQDESFPALSLKTVTDLTAENFFKGISPKISETIKKTLLEIQNQDWAASSEKVSYSGLKDYDGQRTYQFREFKSEDFLVTNGVKKIIQHLSKDLAVKTGSKVTRVSETKEGYQVTYKSQNQTQTIKADHVVITLPLGVLKKNDVDLPLNKAKKTALKRLEMGRVMKIIMKFDRAYWKNKGVDTFWIALCNRKMTENYVFFNLNKALPSINTLVGWAMGDLARQFAKKPEDEIKKFYLRLLEKYYPGCTVENLTYFKCVSWDDDPYARGAYTYIPVGVSPKEIHQLAKPIRKLHFAGEHTSEFLGTLHGAYLSGERAATEIIN